MAIERGHVVTASLVAERQPIRQRRHSVSLVQIHRLDGLRIRPPFEQPRLDGSGRWLDLQVGSTERALDSVLGHEDVVIRPSNAEVDRAHRHLLPEWGERLPHVLRLREYVEDECYRRIELSSGENRSEEHTSELQSLR